MTFVLKLRIQIVTLARINWSCFLIKYKKIRLMMDSSYYLLIREAHHCSHCLTLDEELNTTIQLDGPCCRNDLYTMKTEGCRK